MVTVTDMTTPGEPGASKTSSRSDTDHDKLMTDIGDEAYRLARVILGEMEDEGIPFEDPEEL